ncbi:hypothetical protein DL346_02600 [Paenibacillus montanisoli]|uniref:PKD domain-containing protein n=2 Tax=Paenibacillus montanisoli TaxID=2081970 RepID=A0A328U6K4_9BACL|nr:hypothetical protein DL346_02600 [Paenibacillus montanisoli]
MKEDPDYCASCTVNTKIYRYYIPILFEFQLDGVLEVHHKTTSGANIDAAFADQTKNMTQGQSQSITPGKSEGYTYVGYKKSTVGLPSGGSIITGAPPTFVYDGKYDRYYLNLYYELESVSDGKAHVRHVTTTGQSLDSVFGDHTDDLKNGGYYSPTHPSAAGYNYQGYVKTTTGTPPTDFSSTTAGDYSIPSYDSSSFKTLYLYYVYDVVSAGKVHVRHMVRTNPASIYVQQGGEELIPVATLPNSRTLAADSSYGTVKGKNVSYVAFSNTVTAGSTASVSLTSALPEAYVTFFYEQAIIQPPDENHPPTFEIGFVDPNNNKVPLHKVVEGTTLDLIYINDPSVPTPNDPDGDNLNFQGFDFDAGNAFIQSIPSKSTAYVDGQHGLTMDTIGHHNVCAGMSDSRGATTTECTYIEVVPRNPVPVISCPPSIIANHPVPAGAINGNGSYSPISGRTIDHTRDEWTNKQTSFANATTSDLTVQVSLHVYDSGGLKSLAPATCTIIVKPDLPPIAKLTVPPLSIRGTQLDIVNKSVSQDGDRITKAEYKYKYDANNNGFTDDAWIAVTGTMAKMQIAPTKVGKYLFYLKVTEEYGAWDDTLADPPATLTLDVVNNAPEVSFEMEGKNPQPDLDPYTRITPNAMLNWPVYVPGTDTKVFNVNNLWRSNNEDLVSGEGRNFGSQDQKFSYYRVTRSNVTTEFPFSVPMVNNGYGSNRLSPWRSTSTMTSTLSVPLVDTYDPNGNVISFGDSYMNDLNILKIRSNKKNIFFRTQNRVIETSGNPKYTDRLYALNPKRLSPLEMYVKPGAWFASYRYIGGDPYDFVIDFTLEPSRNVVINSVTKSLNFYTIHDYELANGKYLYMRREWWGYKSGGGREYFYDIAIYDARTGEELKSTFDSPELAAYWNSYDTYGFKDYVFSHSLGDKVAMKRSDSSAENGKLKDGMSWVVLDPALEIVHKARWSQPDPNDSLTAKLIATSGNGSNLDYTFDLNLTTDASGALYSYQAYSLNNSGSSGKYDLNITKYNPDFTLAWRKYLKPETLAGPTNAATFLNFNYSNPDPYGYMVMDIGSNEIVAKLYYDHYPEGSMVPDAVEENLTLNLTTGLIKSRKSSFNGDDLVPTHYGHNPFEAYAAYAVNWSGPRLSIPSSTVTIDGNRTTFLANATCSGSGAQGEGSNAVYDKTGNVAARAGVPCNAGKQIFGEYFGDGVYVSLNKATNSVNQGVALNVSIGTPTTGKPFVQSFTSGQFYSPTSLSDAEVKFNFMVEDVDYDDEWLGFSFRMKDRKNGYALETDAKKIEFVVYKNGARTVLAAQDYTLLNKKSYAVKLQMVDAQFKVFLDNTPLFEVEDDTYTSGRYGYFANKSFTTFGTLAYKLIVTNEVWSDQYAIWDSGTAHAEVQYNNISFTDPENDPSAGGLYDWTVQHTVRFIHNQGLSALHNETFHDAQLAFDKVGDYLVKLKAKDDPNPSYLYPDLTFDSYRKSSNEFSNRITVHRRPVANFTLSSAANGSVIWSDKSYDPDRYYSSADYSTEATGIDYKATKGIIEKRFYYISPSGNYAEEKLVSPQELGTYEVGMAVRDEYDAWSDWHVVRLTVSVLAPPNTPPVPGFTSSHINTYRGVPVTFNSVASDKEDGDRTKLLHDYYLKNTTAGGGETLASDSRTSWNKTFTSMGTFDLRQVVEDSAGATAQFSLQVNVVNRLPAGVITMPSSTVQNNPTKLTVPRPNFTWSYSDADADDQTRYQVKIYKYGGLLQHDSGIKAGSAKAWTPGADLPERVNMYVIVRVYDGYDWSDYSAPKFFYIETNQPPAADFDWLPKPVYEGDMIVLTQTIADPDQDSLSVRYSVTDPVGSSKTFDYADSFPYAASGPSFKGALPGSYSVQLTVSDGKAAPVVVRKTITVLPLTVSGQVKHTEHWNERRKESNLAASGNENSPRSYSVFWAGERFMLEAATTVTGTAAAADQVKVTMNGFTVSLKPANAAKTAWSGDMWEESFEDLPEGPLLFTFTAIYNNGTVKSTEVTVTIAGNIQQTVGVHRVQ